MHHQSNRRAGGGPITRGRSGFTLVELLVVIAIIGILIALLLPAVQAARESGRRTKCANNLHNLGVAVHNYHDINNHLPTSVSPWGERPMPAPANMRTGKGWIITILPQLEQGALWERAEPYTLQGAFFSNQGMRHGNMRAIARTELEVLHCPSDGESERISTRQTQWSGIPVAVTNYKGCIGDTRMGGNASAFVGTMPDTHNNAFCNGMFFRNSYQKNLGLGSVTDGTANTFMIGEDVPHHNSHSAWLYSNGDYASCHANPNYFPNPPNPAYWPNAIGFKSYHPQGLLFCMADASVHYVKQNIDHNLYRALATRHGGESVALP